jgi:hypothetical protein
MNRLSRLSLGGSARATVSASATASGTGALAATTDAGSVCVTSISSGTWWNGEGRAGCMARARGRTETG